MSAFSHTLSNCFVEAGWLPPSKEHFEAWLRKLIEDADKSSKSHLSFSNSDKDKITRAVEDFKAFVLADADMFMGFTAMFENKVDEVRIRDFDHFICMLNHVLHQAPSYGAFGPPLYMLLFRAMDTHAGFTAFLADKLNHRFKLLFDVWAEYLVSPASRAVLNDKEGGWFHKDALDKTTQDFKEADGTPVAFSDIFISDTSKPYWNFASWDDYFNRRFVEVPRPGMKLPRPIEYPPPNPKAADIIGGACESVLYNIQNNVKREDHFWIKGEPYSLEHMLKPSLYTLPGIHDVVELFVGGTILQGFLQVTGYHRWAAPVDGRIVKIVDVPGTYFVQSPALFSDPTTENPNDPKNHPFVRSLAFITSLTARQLIFIESPNKKIGLMCFIAIGMTEISSCESTVKEGQTIKRGEQLGMFHFGGSSHALVFRRGVNIQWFDNPKAGKLIKVRSALGGVQ